MLVMAPFEQEGDNGNARAMGDRQWSGTRCGWRRRLATATGHLEWGCTTAVVRKQCDVGGGKDVVVPGLAPLAMRAPGQTG